MPASASPAAARVAALKGLAAYWDSMASQLQNPAPFQWGADSAISRLSLSGHGAQYSTADVINDMPGLSIGAQVVQDAIAYGGDHPGDTRKGTITASTTSTAAMVQVAVQAVASPARWTVPALVPYSACGAAGNTAYSSAQQLVTDFEAACQAATVAGAPLPITTATRTNPEEQAAHSASPSTEFAPATPAGSGSWSGNDPFEQATAVRVAVTNPATVSWLDAVTGCYVASSNQYTPFPSAEDPGAYAADTASQCPIGALPIKRAQTYGLIPACVGPGETAATPAAVACTGSESDGFARQPGLLLLGQLISVNGPSLSSAVGVGDIPGSCEQVYNFFIGQGFASAQAAGITGNFVQESSCSPEAVQPDGPGRGLAQWSLGGRWQPNLMTGNVAADMPAQLAYVMTELHSDYAFVVPAMQATSDPVTASDVWGLKYEGYGIKGARDTYAQQVYNAANTVWASAAPGKAVS